MFTLIRPKIWGGPGLPGLLGDYIPVKYQQCSFWYTANISAVPSTVNCGVTFPTVIWQYSELLMTLSCCGYCHQRY